MLTAQVLLEIATVTKLIISIDKNERNIKNDPMLSDSLLLQIAKYSLLIN